jgi:hypothetical protein
MIDDFCSNNSYLANKQKEYHTKYDINSTSSIPNYKSLWLFFIHPFCYVSRYNIYVYGVILPKNSGIHVKLPKDDATFSFSYLIKKTSKNVLSPIRLFLEAMVQSATGCWSSMRQSAELSAGAQNLLESTV